LFTVSSFWDLFKPQELIEYGGLALVLIIIFLENGVFFGFFLPGDSLLFTAGLLCFPGDSQLLHTALSALIIGIAVSALLGYYFGYFFGYKTGQAFYKRKDSLFFKKQYIITAEKFYQKYGGFALILGRFLPIVRTFAPILAGVVRVNHATFFLYNLAGAILWPLTIVSAGYYVGSVFPGALHYLDYIVIGFIVVTSIPIINNIRQQRKEKKESEREV
ncbi:MAG: DedA family protein, partial [Bacteroidota bacterium]